MYAVSLVSRKRGAVSRPDGGWASEEIAEVGGSVRLAAVAVHRL